MGRRLLTVAAALWLLVIAAPPAAQAEPGPAITVEPNTGLVDGQTVSATAFGFLAVVVEGFTVEPPAPTNARPVVTRHRPRCRSTRRSERPSKGTCWETAGPWASFRRCPRSIRLLE